MANNSRAETRRAVHSRIRKKVRGTAERPRLAIFRSVNHIYAQVIDDENGKTLAAAATTEKDLKGATGGNTEAAQRIGKAIAERALAAGISNVVYDRGGYVYHGRVKALFEATRAAGLNKSDTDGKADENPPADEAAPKGSAVNAVSSVIGNVADAVSGMISNAINSGGGAAAEKPEKKTRAKKGGEGEHKAQAEAVTEGSNENE
jgi:large subunit ribosomal protein L18